MKGLRFNYAPGYVLGRRARRKPKEVPAYDVILLRLRGRRKHARFDMYLRPDEAIAIAAALTSAVWDDMVNVRRGKCPGA